MKTIIIGAGPAGICCAETLLNHGADPGSIMIFERQTNVTKVCSGMMPPINCASLKLSKEDNIFDDELDIIDIYTARSKYEMRSILPFCYMVDRLSGKFGNYLVDRVSKKGIDVHLGEEVKKIGRKENKITTQEGVYDYDNLVVASGSAKFRQDFGLPTQKSVVCTSIRVPKKELPDQREGVGHCYLVKKSYYCGYTPMNNDVDFCQVFFNPTDFETKSFFNRVRKIEGIDLSDYKMLAKPVHYGGDIARTRVGQNVWFIGDANGFGDIVGGLIGTNAYSGKVAGLEIANKTAERDNFVRKFRNQYHGKTKVLADLVKIYPNELNFLVPFWFDLIFCHKPLIKLILNRLGIKFILPEIAKKLLPLPGEEYKDFDRNYYVKFLKSMVWKTFSHW